MDSGEGEGIVAVADAVIEALKRDLKQPYEEACQNEYDKLSAQNKLKIIPFNQYSEIVRTLEEWDTIKQRTSIYTL